MRLTSLMLNGCTTTRIFCRTNCPPGRRTKTWHTRNVRIGGGGISQGLSPVPGCLLTDGWRAGALAAKGEASIEWVKDGLLAGSDNRCVGRQIGLGQEISRL